MYSTLSICVGRSPSGGPRGQALVTMACQSHPWVAMPQGVHGFCSEGQGPLALMSVSCSARISGRTVSTRTGNHPSVTLHLAEALAASVVSGRFQRESV